MSEDLRLAQDQISNLAENEHREGLDLVEGYSLPEQQCDNWVGIEVIFMIEVTEVCLDGSTGKSTGATGYVHVPSIY